MKNSEYWRGRFSILEDAAHNQANRCISDLERIYQETEQSVRTEIESWYERFATNNGVSLFEAKRLLTTGQLEEFKWNVNQYIQAAQKADLSPEWIRKLENASTRFHVGRLEAIQLQIQQQIELLYGNQLDSVDNLLKGILSNGYTHSAYELQKGLGMGWDITALDQRKLETLLSRPWTGDKKTFRDRCWEHKANLTTGIQTALTQGLLRGDSSQTITDAVKHKFGVSRYKAGRLVHTETTYFNAVSALETYKDLDVEEIEILETLDRLTCEICRDLDGKVIPISQYEPGVTVPPFHPSCRGTTCPHFDDSDFERIARKENGEKFFVPANMTYRQWEQAFLGGGSKSGLTPVTMALTAEAFDQLRATAQQKQGELSNASTSLSSVRMEKRLAELGGDQAKVDRLSEREAALQAQITGLQDDLSKIFKDAGIDSEVGQRAFLSSMERLPVGKLDHSLTPNEIIAKLCGGDQTKGSCSSLGFAYAGNHVGLDVTDFRGGESQAFFSKNSNIVAIAKLPKVNSVIETVVDDFKGTNTLLKTMKESKLYYLATGQHAAIIRKVGNEYEYLELQSARNNGFFKLTTDVLKRRFGCKHSHTSFGTKHALPNVLIDIDSLRDNKEFEQLLDYLNTATDKQMKGIFGYAK